MELDERASAPGDLASRLAREALDPLSHDELVVRIELLSAEIERVRAHMAKAQAHRHAAEALFRTPPPPPAENGPGTLGK